MALSLETSSPFLFRNLASAASKGNKRLQVAFSLDIKFCYLLLHLIL
jgi:hypothetical protein